MIQEVLQASGLADRTSERAGKPVFIHGLWRSGTTFIWSRFREDAHAYCYYEPLHHGLARITRRRIARERPDQPLANRHPALSEPYFSEYRPLIMGRGVRGFHPAFATERWTLHPDEACPKLERYLGGLLDHALSRGRTPVLGFVRSSLRIAWMRRRFGGVHLFIRRAPEAVWGSFRAEQLRGNNAYFLMALDVVRRNAGHRDFRELAEHLGLDAPVTDFRWKRDRLRFLGALGDAETYRIVYWFHRLAAERARSEADLILDLDRLAGDAGSAIEADVRRACGLEIDLTGCRPAHPRVQFAEPARREVELSVEEALGLGPSRSVRARTPAVRTPPQRRPWAPLVQGSLEAGRGG